MRLDFILCTSQVHLIFIEVLVPRDQLASSFYPTCVSGCSSSLPILHRPRGRRERSPFRGAWINIPSLEILPSHLVGPTGILLMCVLTHFFQSVPLALEFRPLILGGGVVADESRWLGTLILVIITSERLPFSHGLYADTASLACPAHLGCLATTSITLGAAMCDAEDPCSVNTRNEPESSVTIAPWRTRRPLSFWNLSSKWHKSRSVGKWNVLPPFRASSITLLCWIILLLLTVFVNCGLRTRGLHCLGHKNGFVHWIFVTRRIFMIFVLSLCSALSCQFVSLAKTCENSFVFLLVIFAKDLSCHCSSRIFPCGCSSSAFKDKFPEVFHDAHGIAAYAIQLLSLSFQGF